MGVLNAAEINAGGGSVINPFGSFPTNGRQVRKIKIVADSFGTTLAGQTPGSWVEVFAANLRAAKGDAGAGYIPWGDKMAGRGGTANWGTVTGLGLSPSNATQLGVSWPWDDVHRATAPNGMCYYRDAGAGKADINEVTSYTPNVLDSYNRGVADILANGYVHFTLRSARAGFGIKESDLPADNIALVSSGAQFTGAATASAVMGVSALDGVIAAGAYLTGPSVPAARAVTSGGVGTYGGTGNYNITASSTISGTVTASGNVQARIGIPQRVAFVKTAGRANNVQIAAAYGDVLVGGIEHYNGNAGVTFTDAGQPGTSAVQLASLDDAAQRAYYQTMDYDDVILCVGMNDRTIYTPTAYGAAIATIVGRIQSNKRTRVFLIRQTDPSGASATWFAYENVLKNVASMMGCAYWDMKSASPNLATYAAAVAAGLMADGVHINAAANTIVGNAFTSLYLSTVP